jgi:hypothetical protein
MTSHNFLLVERYKDMSYTSNLLFLRLSVTQSIKSVHCNTTERVCITSVHKAHFLVSLTLLVNHVHILIINNLLYFDSLLLANVIGNTWC